MAVIDELDQLTGEQLYHLLGVLNEAIVKTACATYTQPVTEDATQALNRMIIDLIEVEADARAQLARITIPLREASAIIWRARYARGHPVRVVSTP